MATSVLAIKAERDVLACGKRDEEGGLGAVVDAGTCHGDRAALELVGEAVVDIVFVELANDGRQRRVIARGAIALRAALQAKALDDAVELETIVVSVLGEAAEVRDRHRCRIGIQLDSERVEALDLDDGMMRACGVFARCLRGHGIGIDAL